MTNFTFLSFLECIEHGLQAKEQHLFTMQESLHYLLPKLQTGELKPSEVCILI